MPLGGLIPYEDEDMELPVSLDEGDLNDGQFMGPDGDRNLPAGETLQQRLVRRRGPKPPMQNAGGMGMPGMMGPGMMGMNPEDPTMEVVQALMGKRG